MRVKHLGNQRKEGGLRTPIEYSDSKQFKLKMRPGLDLSAGACIVVITSP